MFFGDHPLVQEFLKTYDEIIKFKVGLASLLEEKGRYSVNSRKFRRFSSNYDFHGLRVAHVFL